MGNTLGDDICRSTPPLITRLAARQPSKLGACGATAPYNNGAWRLGVGTKVAPDGERWRRCDERDRAARYCCVCMSACRDGEEIRSLPCGHAFHRDCVDRWLARCRRTCPLCRAHVGGGGAVGLADEEEQHQLSEDLVIWFSSLFIAGLP
ncbi:hypothetical protein C2845_PM01G41790 [Panicum miliaceum]|uniref:RING-type E3 ubiquitin transferase n=1 Tax=Panicum miliaceum TaxID=4540 RepID=A0A3L6TNI6_PANMI|nr:hypothetical protein C2845_PM01G41790 [Panicum miliaceum]